MNGKYALALILALQVSMSLCEVPQPDRELVEKYEGLKNTFYRRLLNAFSKLSAATAPLMERVEQNDNAQIVRGKINELKAKPEFNAAVKIASGVVQEAAPLVDKARMSVLGVYGQYLRPHIGAHLDSAINHIKIYLDQVLPAE